MLVRQPVFGNMGPFVGEGSFYKIFILDILDSVERYVAVVGRLPSVGIYGFFVSQSHHLLYLIIKY